MSIAVKIIKAIANDPNHSGLTIYPEPNIRGDVKLFGNDYVLRARHYIGMFICQKDCVILELDRKAICCTGGNTSEEDCVKFAMDAMPMVVDYFNSVFTARTAWQKKYSEFVDRCEREAYYKDFDDNNHD